MKPLPVSWSHLDQFNTCPRQFHGKTIAKKFPFEESEQQKWGNYVHEHFEKFIKNGCPLPADIWDAHQPYLNGLAAMKGEKHAELKMGLDRKLKPCDYWDKENVFLRAGIDFLNLGERDAYIVDYKTGKVNPKWGQLKLNVLCVFHTYPHIEAVRATFYWTQTKAESTPQMFTRAQIKDLWAEVMPTLKQMKEAYETELWPERKSGLCRAWCPDIECMFNGRNPDNV